MILDRSVLVAVVLHEPDAERLLTQMRDASHLAIGAATLLDTGIVLSARLNLDARVRRRVPSATVLPMRWPSFRASRCFVSETIFRKRIACSHDRERTMHVSDRGQPPIS